MEGGIIFAKEGEPFLPIFVETWINVNIKN